MKIHLYPKFPCMPFETTVNLAFKDIAFNASPLNPNVFMVYIYASLEKSLRKNQDRFERSGGEDRSLMPGIVMQTWANVTKNFIPYLDLFGNNFVATTKDQKLQKSRDLEDIIDQYISPFTPTDTKEKSEKEQARSAAAKEKLEQEVRDLMSKENVTKAVQQVVSPDEAQAKLKSFLAS